jgi:hypothetical protein
VNKNIFYSKLIVLKLIITMTIYSDLDKGKCYISIKILVELSCSTSFIFINYRTSKKECVSIILLRTTAMNFLKVSQNTPPAE